MWRFDMPKWSKKDLEFLSSHYDKEGRLELAKRTGRTLQAVATMAKKRGWTIKTGTDPQILDFLRENYVKLGATECAKRLGMSKTLIYRLTTNNNIRGGRNFKWNPSEEEFLRMNCRKKSMLEMARHLQRTISSVKNKANKLGILENKRWVKNDDGMLRNEYGKIPIDILAKKLQRTPSSIMGRAFLLHLTVPNHIWSSEDDQWLKTYYPVRSNLHCAIKIGTTESSVVNRAHVFGLVKTQIEYVAGDVKKCHSCHKSKEISEYQFKKEHNGYSASCKDCLNERAKKRKPILTSDQENRIRQLHSECYGVPEIANIVKFCGKSKISQFVKWAGLSRTVAQAKECKTRKRTGEKVGKLTLVEYMRVDGRPGWRCLCDCGNEKLIKQIYLRTTKSCGCMVRVKGDMNQNWTGCGDVSGQIVSRYRGSARSRNIAFHLDEKDMWEQFMKQDRRCAFTGLLLTLSARSSGTASLDRIDSSKGYVVDNIQWVHKWLNTMKNDLRESDMFGIMKAVYEYRHLDKMELPEIHTTLNRIKRKSSI